MVVEVQSGPWLLRAETLVLDFEQPFRIARAEDPAVATTVVTELRHAGFPDLVGLGEGFPTTYYGETASTMAAVFPLLLNAIGEADLSVSGLETAATAMAEALRWNGAARCAIDTSLHDLAGKAAGQPVHALLGLSTALPPTDFTIGIDEPAVVARRAEAVSHFPALKIKVGGAADLATLEAVRRVFAGPIRVDANTAWDPTTAADLLPEMVRLGVELIEQPFPAHRLDWLRDLQDRSSLPIVADESAVTIEDLESLKGVVQGVNVKLAKCGGIGPARNMLERARELGFRTFLGCMEETTLGIAASAVVASLADWVDLDGNLLLAADPFEGLELGSDCRWRLGQGAGLGVTRRDTGQGEQSGIMAGP
jgi:L-alanine-DL-glutamate epimerase-like enolase superfamily enzyme